jgi:hypothetical protein
VEPDNRDRWTTPTFGTDPDRDSWTYRFGAISNGILRSLGIPRPVRYVLFWPILVLFVLVWVVVEVVSIPVRLFRRFVNPS